MLRIRDYHCAAWLVSSFPFLSRQSGIDSYCSGIHRFFYPPLANRFLVLMNWFLGKFVAQTLMGYEYTFKEYHVGDDGKPMQIAKQPLWDLLFG